MLNSSSVRKRAARYLIAIGLAISLTPILSLSNSAIGEESKHAARAKSLRHAVIERQRHDSNRGSNRESNRGPVHWGYEGSEGPEFWAGLSPNFEACERGRAQSPIDFSKPIVADMPELSQQYRPSVLRIANNGHTIQVNYDHGSALRIDGETYELKQFHFHTPSEHTVDGRAFPMEVHFVHQAKSGQLAVVGAFIKYGSANLALSEIWRHLPMEQGDERTIEDTVINAGDMLPIERGYYRYMGSLTTPPCSEGVKWFVMKEPMGATLEQIQQFTSIFSMNARPIRSVNGRLVLGE